MTVSPEPQDAVGARPAAAAGAAAGPSADLGSTGDSLAADPPRSLAFDERGRARAAAEQEAAMPRGEVVVSCSAPLGRGGLGRHLEEVLGALQRSGAAGPCICEEPEREPPSGAERLSRALMRVLRPPGRISPAWRMWRASVEFDLCAAHRLPRVAHLIGFNGTSEFQFRKARNASYESLSLVSANPHYRLVVRQHRLAYRRHPVERPWSSLLLPRNLREYARAERILVSSEYVRRSFLDEGFAEESLVRFPLTPHPRFTPTAGAPASDTFDAVFMGALTVEKGVPLLVDAARRLPHGDLRLVLVGGWPTRAMRLFVQRACAADARISVSPDDPLGRLRSASVFVHPSYLDGFGYAPAEALACGVPVIVSEDTGMKELLDRGRNGLVVPTGDVDALAEAIDAAYRGEAFERAGASRWG